MFTGILCVCNGPTQPAISSAATRLPVILRVFIFLSFLWYPPARSGADGSCFIHTETKIRPDWRSSSERNAKEIHIIKFTDSYWSHIRFYSFADQLVYRQPIFRVLFRTLASISTPCSVKAYRRLLEPPLPGFAITICDFKESNSSAVN